MTAAGVLTGSATAFFTRALLNAADAGFVASATDLTSRGLPGMNKLTSRDERTFGRAIQKSAQALKSVGVREKQIESAQLWCAALLDRVPADVARSSLTSATAPLDSLAGYAPQRGELDTDDQLVSRTLTDIFAAFGQRRGKHPEFASHRPGRPGGVSSAA